MKKVVLVYDQVISSFDELISQLKSIKSDSTLMMGTEPVFLKDVHALRIVIDFLEENKDLLK